MQDDLKPASASLATRREAIALGAGAMVAAGMPAAAQDREEAYQQLIELFDLALSVRSIAVELTLGPDVSLLADFVESDYLARYGTLGLARETGIFEEAESAIAYVEALPRILPQGIPVDYDEVTVASQIAVIELIAEQELEIVPPPEFVTPTGAPAIPSYEDREDTNLIVVVDIVLETLGITFGDVNLIVSIIESDERLMAAIDDLIGSISTQDWEDVVRTAEAVFKFFVASEAWAVIRGEFGRKLSLRLALRAVPIVGWVYCSAAFVVAIKANYHRFSFS